MYRCSITPTCSTIVLMVLSGFPFERRRTKLVSMAHFRTHRSKVGEHEFGWMEMMWYVLTGWRAGNAINYGEWTGWEMVVAPINYVVTIASCCSFSEKDRIQRTPPIRS